MTYLPPVVIDSLISELSKYKDGKPFDPEKVVATALANVFDEDRMNRHRALSWIESFSIFAKYEHTDGYFATAAEHDVFYAGPRVTVVSSEDIARLKELGWNTDIDDDGFFQFT